MTIREQAERLGIKPPTKPTLRKYGLDELDWLNLLALQGWVCPICTRRSKLWNVDHEHVPGFKKMPPAQRRRYVRGVICAWDNRWFVHSNLDSGKAARVAAYIKAYEARRDA